MHFYKPGKARSKQVTPFSQAAEAYHRTGWEVVPIGGTSKANLPPGVTGRNGISPDLIEIKQMIDQGYLDCFNSGSQSRYRFHIGNIGLRMLRGYMAIDVDHYDGKVGGDSLAALSEKLGPLPPTYSSTARGKDSVARQYIFQIPEHIELPVMVGEHLDVIQRHHRHMTVWPSTHEKSGAQYRWYDFDGEELIGVPAPEKVPFLPESWWNHLTDRKKSNRPKIVKEPRNYGNPQTYECLIVPDEWKSVLVEGAPIHRTMQARISESIAEFGKGRPRHKSLVPAICYVLRLASRYQRVTGGYAALEQIRNHFVEIVTADGSRTSMKAEREFYKALEFSFGEVEPPK
jgi:hypothetical protein